MPLLSRQKSDLALSDQSFKSRTNRLISNSSSNVGCRVNPTRLARSHAWLEVRDLFSTDTHPPEKDSLVGALLSCRHPRFKVQTRCPSVSNLSVRPHPTCLESSTGHGWICTEVSIALCYVLYFVQTIAGRCAKFKLVTYFRHPVIDSTLIASRTWLACKGEPGTDQWLNSWVLATHLSSLSL